MAKVQILPGHEYDIVSPAELHHAFQREQERMDAFMRDSVRGIKPLRLQPQYQEVAAGAFSGVIMGPASGYAWVVKRLTTYGIAAADVNTAVINLYFGAEATDSLFIDQLIPNAAWKGSADCLVVNSGEDLFILGTGVPSTSQVLVTGFAVEVPSEMIGKVLM